MMSKTIPTGKLKRAQVAGMAAVKVSARHLGHFSKRPFLSKKQAELHRQQVDDASAQTIFDTLSHLRGTALKVAQMLSMESDLLPERYRLELSKSYHQVPPLNRALMRKVVIAQLGDSPENIFASFEAQAFAAASLGQVHAAISKKGQKLAVKVQYPGIADTIKSDIQLVKRLTRTLPESDMISLILNEVEARMLEETDYELEAANARWFAQHLHMEQVIIPAVDEAWSSKQILCMQHLGGLHLHQWLETKPSQQQRDEFAQIIYDLYIHSVFELHRLHADPNPGNYLFCDNGKLGLIDFGCIKSLTPVFADNLSRLYQSILHDDHETVFDAYRELGMLNTTVSDATAKEYYQEVITPLGKWLSNPFKNNTFDFAVNRGYAAQGLKMYDKIRTHRAFKSGYLKLNTDFVFTDRTLYGLYKIFEEMGATVRMQNRWIC